jgi:hypothetical protein
VQTVAVEVGLGEAVAVSSGSVDLGKALNLILQPLLMATLVAVGEGKALEDALPADTDTELLGAALNRLVTIGAVEPMTGHLLGHHSLTRRGERLLGLLDNLDAAIMRTEKIRRS